tara:strand:- start:244 stop:528 length:285 start_codon:yes stop_codon:yes gene_type:complete
MPHDNINNRTATPLELASARKESANALLSRALTKAATLEPPYNDDLTMRREIQGYRDLVRVEDQWYNLVVGGFTLPAIIMPGIYSSGIPNPGGF